MHKRDVLRAKLMVADIADNGEMQLGYFSLLIGRWHSWLLLGGMMNLVKYLGTLKTSLKLFSVGLVGEILSAVTEPNQTSLYS